MDINNKHKDMELYGMCYESLYYYQNNDFNYDALIMHGTGISYEVITIDSIEYEQLSKKNTNIFINGNYIIRNGTLVFTDGVRVGYSDNALEFDISGMAGVLLSSHYNRYGYGSGFFGFRFITIVDSSFFKINESKLTLIDVEEINEKIQEYKAER